MSTAVALKHLLVETLSLLTLLSSEQSRSLFRDLLL